MEKEEDMDTTLLSVLEHLDHAIEKSHPDDRNLLVLERVQILLILGRFEEAITDCKSCNGLDREQIEYLLKEGENLELLRQGLKVDPDSEEIRNQVKNIERSMYPSYERFEMFENWMK